MEINEAGWMFSLFFRKCIIREVFTKFTEKIFYRETIIKFHLIVLHYERNDVIAVKKDN